MLFDSYYREMDVVHEGDDGGCSSGLHHKTAQKEQPGLKGPGVFSARAGPLTITADEDLYSCGLPAPKLRCQSVNFNVVLAFPRRYSLWRL